MMKYLTQLWILLLFPVLLNAQSIPEPMSPPRLVNDFAGFFNANEQNALETKLLQFNNQTSTQIYVVTVSDLQGYDKAQFATRLGHEWKVGQKDEDNGAVILIKPKTADSKGEVFIATGYGLEGLIPDAIAKRIVENEILPNFRQGNFYAGVDKAINTMMNLTRGEFTADQYIEQTRETANPVAGIFILLFIIFVIRSLVGVGSVRRRSLGRDIPFWVALSMLGSSGSSRRGSFGGFSSGSGGFGGFSGGGGGGFGGGGAGGSW